MAVAIEPLCLAPAEIRKQSEHVDLAHLSEESVQRHCFFRKIRFQFLKIEAEVCRNGKARTIGKMEVVHRIHLDPAIRDAKIQKQFSGDRGWVSEQRVKMCSRIERITIATK